MADITDARIVQAAIVNKPVNFQLAYMLAYKLAESGCPGSNVPSKSVMGLFQLAYEEFQKLNPQS